MIGALLSEHDWLRSIRMASYGFLLYGPGTYAWYSYLDRCMPKQSVENVLMKVVSFMMSLYQLKKTYFLYEFDQTFNTLYFRFY